MSFSSKVKSELLRQFGSTRNSSLAEIAGIINTCGQINISLKNEVTIKVQTENASVARKYFTLLKKTFNINIEIIIRKNSQLKKNRYYLLYVMNDKKAREMLEETKLIKEQDGSTVYVNNISDSIIQDIDCKRAYIRGAFLGGGSLSNPEKTYHLEFVNHTYEHCESLQHLINSFEMDSKIVQRKKYFVVYLKEGEQIVNLLNIIQAHLALMDLENVRIIKEMRNNVNRLVNCETANLNKTVSAAVKQIDDIEYINRMVGLDSLSDGLKEVAQYRVEYSDASLKELGMMLTTPVGKSGVNHRLRKISEIAQKIRFQRGETI